MLVQLAVVFTAFGTARWGRPAVVALSALSMPVAAAIGALYLRLAGIEFGRLSSLVDLVGYEQAARVGDQSWVVLIGLSAWRCSACRGWPGSRCGSGTGPRSRRPRRWPPRRAPLAPSSRPSSRGRSPSCARSQARLARDVHDVVGHSLAVILAQAESAQYLEDADTEKLKQTMANIATSARSSLQDVRHVLTADARLGPTQPGSLDALIDGRARERPRGGVERGRQRRSRCRPSSTSSPTGCCRRCSPTPSSTAGATTRCSSSGTGRASCGSRCATWSSPAPRRPRPARASTACAAGSSRSADGSTYAVASEAGRTTFTATAWIPVRSR